MKLVFAMALVIFLCLVAILAFQLMECQTLSAL